MQLKVNACRQKQEKYTFSLSSPLFSLEGLFTGAFEVPPALPSEAASPMLALWVPWHCDAGTQYWRWAAVTPQRRLPHRWSHKYSFQIGFSPLFTIYWIVLVHEAERGVCWGRTRPLCAGKKKKTIESIRQEPNAHQINSSRREETGPWLRTPTHTPLTEITSLRS